MTTKVPASQVVIALAEMASNGKYDNVTPMQAQKMNKLFEAVAEVINWLEEAEKNNLEQEKQDVAATLMDEEVDIEGVI